MLRHELKLRTSRTPEAELEATRGGMSMRRRGADRARYAATRRQAQPGTASTATTRPSCSAYADAVAGKRTFVAQDLNDLEAVAREREEVARIAKIAYARKGELEDILKSRLADTEKLELGGVRYQVTPTCSVDYPIEATLKLLQEATGLPRDTLVAKLATVDRDALQRLLKDVGERLPRPRVTMLRAELEARANKTFTPRFLAKQVRA